MRIHQIFALLFAVSLATMSCYEVPSDVVEVIFPREITRGNGFDTVFRYDSQPEVMYSKQETLTTISGTLPGQSQFGFGTHCSGYYVAPPASAYFRLSLGDTFHVTVSMCSPYSIRQIHLNGMGHVSLIHYDSLPASKDTFNITYTLQAINAGRGFFVINESRDSYYEDGAILICYSIGMPDSLGVSCDSLTWDYLIVKTVPDTCRSLNTLTITGRTSATAVRLDDQRSTQTYYGCDEYNVAYPDAEGRFVIVYDMSHRSYYSQYYDDCPAAPNLGLIFSGMNGPDQSIRLIPPW